MRGILPSCLLVLALGACSRPETGTEPVAFPEAADGAKPGTLLVLPPADDPYTIVFLGDSLFAGFGLGEGQSAPDIFARRFTHPQGVAVEIVNSGRDGGTAQRALDAFDRRVPEGADAVLIEFGANDVYAGRALDELEADLVALAERARALGARPVVVGMGPPSRAPGKPPSGPWIRAAASACADFYPYYFQAIIDAEGRTLDRGLMQPDGLHPNAAGAEAVGASLAQWMEEALARPAPCEDKVFAAAP